MKNILIVPLVLLFCIDAAPANAGITLNHQNATVWSRQQTITGRLAGFYNPAGSVSVNGTDAAFSVAANSTFSVSVDLRNGLNTIVAQADSAGTICRSDTLRYILGYRLRPDAYVYATVSGRTVTLHVSVIDNPDGGDLMFDWIEDGRNPQLFTLLTNSDSVTSVEIPSGAAPGEYCFTAAVRNSAGDTTLARTFVTVDSTDIHPFNIRTDHARWIDSAVVYGVTPYIFVGTGKFSNITAKIPELKGLGINTVWIQPVYTTHGGGQGYDVIDYFGVRADLGTPGDLHALVDAAHAAGMKVLFDFVPNHTSIYHPYAQDAIQFGSRSHYYDFYQRQKDAAPYSENENYRTTGKMTFVYYFWNELVNLNYDNPEVQRMIIEAGKKWIAEYDIDGYRIDAMWGPNARKPEFMKQWRLALKRIKPEVLLLGEDKASQAQAFDERFDAAYDWTAEYSWVSHWVWNTQYDNPYPSKTVFNFTAENQRSAFFRNSITNNGNGYAAGAKVFRYLENNDTYRFLATHDLARTTMAATMMFTLDGIPLIYNGQEIGALAHPYETYAIFANGSTIQSRDSYGLFPLYRHLAAIRTRFPSLYGSNRSEVPVTPDASVYACRRWEGSQNIFVAMNMAGTPVNAALRLPVVSLQLDPSKTYYLTDLVTNEYIAGTPDMLDTISIPLAKYTTRAFVLADSVVNITDVHVPGVSVLPREFRLEQNTPNPFNPSTTISFTITKPDLVSLKIYDILGREVTTLLNERKYPGSYSVQWNAGTMPSGVYFYRLQSGPFSSTKKMVLVK